MGKLPIVGDMRNIIFLIVYVILRESEMQSICLSVYLSVFVSCNPSRLWNSYVAQDDPELIL